MLKNFGFSAKCCGFHRNTHYFPIFKQNIFLFDKNTDKPTHFWSKNCAKWLLDHLAQCGNCLLPFLELGVFRRISSWFLRFLCNFFGENPIKQRAVPAAISCMVRQLSTPDTFGIVAAVLFSHVIARSEATWQSASSATNPPQQCPTS
jgi:hypothetical protein